MFDPFAHVQVTLPPLVTEPLDGEKELLETDTASVGPGAGGGDGGGAGGGGGGGGLDPVLLPHAAVATIAAITNIRINDITISP